MNKILVPFDFSDVAMNALNFAVQLTKQNEACELVVLNVIEHPSHSAFQSMGVQGYDPMENLFIKRLIDSVEAKLEDLLSQEPYKGIKSFYKLKLGNPYHEITKEINEEKAELVVMGTEGASGTDEMFVGSNAERVVRGAECPVITLREPADVAEINDIVFASNFHEVTPNFVDHVLKLQKAFDAELKIVKINTPANFTTTRHDQELMEDFVKRFDIQNCSTSIYNYTNEEDGIVAFAEDIDADMVALGTHQRTGVGHFLLGSIAEDVVNHAKRPVWTFSLEN